MIKIETSVNIVNSNTKVSAIEARALDSAVYNFKSKNKSKKCSINHQGKGDNMGDLPPVLSNINIKETLKHVPLQKREIKIVTVMCIK